MRVGFFDSGLGGLSVLREVLSQAPQLELDYYADQARIPWGPRPADELRQYCQRITDRLQQRGCSHIVVACNTASAVALQYLRAQFPSLRFVGMEPAVKPAAALTRSGVVGLLATSATLAGELLANTKARHAAHVQIVSDPCLGLVDAIEAGDGVAVRRCLQRILPPMLQAGADVLVLGCTHYPFARDLLEELTGPEVRIVDPAPAVAAQLLRLHAPPPTSAPAAPQFFTSGDPRRFEAQVRHLLGRDCQATQVDWAG